MLRSRFHRTTRRMPHVEEDYTQQESPEPGRMSFSHPTPQQEGGYVSGRHSFSYGEGEFLGGLFGANMTTPESAAQYMSYLQTIGSPPVPSFQYPQQDEAGPSTSTRAHRPYMRHFEEAIAQQQESIPTVGAEPARGRARRQPVERERERVQPPRNRHPPGCGTHSPRRR